MLFRAVALAMQMQFALPPVVLTGGTAVVPLDAKQVRSLEALARSETHTVALQLDDVVADRSPGIYWEVYVGPKAAPHDPNGPYFVGNVALFGSGIRSEAPSGFKPAHFVFALNRALRAARRANAGQLVIALVPRAVGDHAEPLAPVRIGRVRVLIEQQPRM